MDLFSKAFGIHERALGVRSQRLEVLSRNIANADTPNYKAEELDFKAMLKETSREYISATHAKHYAALEEQPDDGKRFRVPFNSTFDGNTVEISVEQAQFGQAAAEYQTTLNFLENRIGGIRKALKGE
ncbi:MAG: flagellar basal body rod protein FlgB [Limnohabitans sp.]|jgi:flagellar basal-body rod protein FlgB|nr:flagellar basal body rod protein FlgB [Burkholderiales bacterium]MCE2677263.1 flagellar basal body rod protein FlgB [Burkholderiaceae bacterium]